jgi:hypothetical protein
MDNMNRRTVLAGLGAMALSSTVDAKEGVPKNWGELIATLVAYTKNDTKEWYALTAMSEKKATHSATEVDG